MSIGGALPMEPLQWAARALLSFAVSEFRPQDFRMVTFVEETPSVLAVEKPPPRVIQMCEWMARTAAPVRGPNAWV